MQQILFKESRALEVASVDLAPMLRGGDTINFPYMSAPQFVDYTKGSPITSKTVYTGVDQMTITTAKVAPITVEDIDRIQSNWSIQAAHAKNAQRGLNNILDQVVNYYGITYANNYIDAAAVGGSAGSNISMSVSNYDQIMVGLDTKLNTLDVNPAGRFVMVGPRMKGIQNRYLGGKETSMGDVIGQNGRIADRFGFEMYYSNNNYYTATWTPADAPTAADTVTINGAVLEFVAAPDSGEASSAYIGVDQSGTLGTAIDNLVAAINDSGTEGTTYGTTDANNWEARWKLTKCGAAGTNVSDTSMTLVAYGDVVVAASETADVWSSQTSYVLCGLKKSVKIAWQVKPEIDVRPADSLLARDIYIWTLYGALVPSDMKNCLVYAKIDASTWT